MNVVERLNVRVVPFQNVASDVGSAMAVERNRLPAELTERRRESAAAAEEFEQAHLFPLQTSWTLERSNNTPRRERRRESRVVLGRLAWGGDLTECPFLSRELQ